jgi:hypothetical protein
VEGRSRLAIMGLPARMDRYLAGGPPGPEHRVTREEFRAQLGAQLDDQ